MLFDCPWCSLDVAQNEPMHPSFTHWAHVGIILREYTTNISNVTGSHILGTCWDYILGVTQMFPAVLSEFVCFHLHLFIFFMLKSFFPPSLLSYFLFMSPTNTLTNGHLDNISFFYWLQGADNMVKELTHIQHTHISNSTSLGMWLWTTVLHQSPGHPNSPGQTTVPPYTTTF